MNTPATSFEQLVVLRRQLPPPEEFGFAAEENVRLAVLTEWFNPPPPRRSAKALDLREAYQALGIVREETLVDETLSFGAMRMVEGKTFALGEPDLGVPTGKTWETLRGPQGEARPFLMKPRRIGCSNRCWMRCRLGRPRFHRARRKVCTPRCGGCEDRERRHRCRRTTSRNVPTRMSALPRPRD